MSVFRCLRDLSVQIVGTLRYPGRAGKENEESLERGRRHLRGKNKLRFLRGKLEGMIGVRLSAICCQTFSLSVVLDLALKRYGSVMRTSRTKARF